MASRVGASRLAPARPVHDPPGVVAKVLRKVRPGEHDELVLKALEEATSPLV